MECKSVKISEFVLNKIRETAKKIGSPSDDTAMRHIIAENERMEIEIESLKKDLKELKRKKV
jgi:hypothetical protein